MWQDVLKGYITEELARRYGADVAYLSRNTLKADFSDKDKANKFKEDMRNKGYTVSSKPKGPYMRITIDGE